MDPTYKRTSEWKLLSSQITNLKDQLLRYEEQLVSKQTEINKLNEDIKKCKWNKAIKLVVEKN